MFVIVCICITTMYFFSLVCECISTGWFSNAADWFPEDVSVLWVESVER